MTDYVKGFTEFTSSLYSRPFRGRHLAAIPASQGVATTIYAIIKTSGKQYKVDPGTEIEINRIAEEPGATVTLEVVEHLRGPKLIAFKMKRRKRSRVKKGHRQDLTKVVVKAINA